MSTLQTPQPLEHTSMQEARRMLREMARQVDDGLIDVNPPYQRGEAWTPDQQRLLFRSFLTGIPVPAVIINNRGNADWVRTDPWQPGEAVYAVIDGKQRLLAGIAWENGELDLPASWMDPDWIATTHDTPDGKYVASTDLTEKGRRLFACRCGLPLTVTALPSVEAEAATFLLVNRSGTEMSDADYARAETLTADR